MHKPMKFYLQLGKDAAPSAKFRDLKAWNEIQSTLNESLTMEKPDDRIKALTTYLKSLIAHLKQLSQGENK